MWITAAVEEQRHLAWDGKQLADRTVNSLWRQRPMWSWRECAPVAQGIEQRPSNPPVGGSIPSWGTETSPLEQRPRGMSALKGTHSLAPLLEKFLEVSEHQLPGHGGLLHFLHTRIVALNDGHSCSVRFVSHVVFHSVVVLGNVREPRGWTVMSGLQQLRRIENKYGASVLVPLRSALKRHLEALNPNWENATPVSTPCEWRSQVNGALVCGWQNG